MLVCGIQISWTQVLFGRLVHLGMLVWRFLISPLWSLWVVLLSSHGLLVAGPLLDGVRLWRCHLCTSAIVCFSYVASNAIFSMYMLAVVGDNCESISKPSSCRYISDPKYSQVFCLCVETQNLHQVLCGYIGAPRPVYPWLSIVRG